MTVPAMLLIQNDRDPLIPCESQKKKDGETDEEQRPCWVNVLSDRWPIQDEYDTECESTADTDEVQSE